MNTYCCSSKYKCKYKYRKGSILTNTNINTNTNTNTNANANTGRGVTHKYGLMTIWASCQLQSPQGLYVNLFCIASFFGCNKYKYVNLSCIASFLWLQQIQIQATNTNTGSTRPTYMSTYFVRCCWRRKSFLFWQQLNCLNLRNYVSSLNYGIFIV